MDIEVDDTISSLEKIPKKPVTKKGSNEPPANVYEAEAGIRDSKAVSQFCSDLQSAVTLEEQIRLMTVLNKTSPDLIDKFIDCKGLEVIADLLAKSGTQAQDKAELIEKILSFLNKITLKSDILERTQIHKHVENIQKCLDMPENLCSSAFRLSIKWKNTIEDWTRKNKKSSESLGKSSVNHFKKKSSTGHPLEHSGDHSHRNFIKRTHERSYGKNYDTYRSTRDHGRDSRISDRRRSRIFDRHERRRDKSPPHPLSSRSRSCYDRDHSTHRKRRTESPSSSSDSERSQKKNVKWTEDTSLCVIKFFRFNDEPTAPGLCEEEVQKIRQQLKELTPEELVLHSPKAYKHKEILLEALAMKMKKDSEKELEQKLTNMQERLKFVPPRKIKLDPDNLYAKNVGRGSIEAERQRARTASKLSCLYLKDYQIPKQPSYEGAASAPTHSNESPVAIPLHNMNEIQEVVTRNEYKAHREEKKAGKIEEKEINEASSTGSKDSPQNAKQNLKSILKKSKEELRRIRMEEKRKMELQKKAEENRKNEEMLANLIQEEVPSELKQDVIAALKHSKNASNIVENVKMLLETEKMHSQQNLAQNSELNGQLFADRFQQDHLHGDQLEKRIRINPEAYNPQQPLQNGLLQHQQFLNIPINPPLMNYNCQLQQYHQPQPNAIVDDERHNSFSSNIAGKKPYKPQNYKTVPCRLFHSPQGCQYGDGCHYIHDPNYAGRETPNMHKHFRSSNRTPQAYDKTPTFQKKDSGTEANVMNVINEKNTSATLNPSVPSNINNSTTTSRENLTSNTNTMPLPSFFNVSTNIPLQHIQTPGSLLPNSLPYHSQQPTQIEPRLSTPSEGRSNHQPNLMHITQGISQQLPNQGYHMPPFSQPISGGPSHQIPYPNAQQFHLNKPLIQHQSGHPFQQPPYIQHPGPPHLQPNQFNRPPESRGFHNHPHSTYPKTQPPGAIPFISNYQGKHPNSGYGPPEGTLHNLAYKNNINNINAKKSQDHKQK